MKNISIFEKVLYPVLILMMMSRYYFENILGMLFIFMVIVVCMMISILVRVSKK